MCVVDQTSKIKREAMVASDPDAIAQFMAAHAPDAVRIGLEWYILQNMSAEARAALRKVVETCPKTVTEYADALAELKRLKP